MLHLFTLLALCRGLNAQSTFPPNQTCYQQETDELQVSHWIKTHEDQWLKSTHLLQGSFGHKVVEGLNFTPPFLAVERCLAWRFRQLLIRYCPWSVSTVCLVLFLRQESNRAEEGSACNNWKRPDLRETLTGIAWSQGHPDWKRPDLREVGLEQPNLRNTLTGMAWSQGHPDWNGLVLGTPWLEQYDLTDIVTETGSHGHFDWNGLNLETIWLERLDFRDT